jgi:fructose-bisphosphate aldolase class I
MLFDEIYAQGILLEGMILKPNMMLPGLDCPTKSGINEVADTTITCLLQIVPAAVSGIAFLSGGQPPEVATAHLNAMNTRFMARLPWPVTFSFARAILAAIAAIVQRTINPQVIEQAPPPC